MIELPETYVLAEQIEQTLTGKTIKNVVANAHPHSFAWHEPAPDAYGAMLNGKRITGANPGTGYTCGGNTEIVANDTVLIISTPIKYHKAGEKLPKSHQLLLEFDDESHLSCTVQMWGSMFCYPASVLQGDTMPEHFAGRRKPDPLTEAFNEAYFDTLWNNTKQNLSAKAFLATEQRIPGLGNGVLQDILLLANIHPKRKLETMNDNGKTRMFNSVKSTLTQMRDEGGRDTEKDLFNNKGGYATYLSKNTLQHPCRICGDTIIRQAFLGGNIYFCPTCQPLG
ncbi:MAG: endonuclease VIII [Defluviitaleaceae bacterium]|nr:endonuclease VIII [Defluviitaleaceae bacterium]